MDKNKNLQTYGTLPQTGVKGYDGTRLLQASLRTANETEAIGASTLNELEGQRATLEDTKSNLTSMQGITQSARAAIREIRNKSFREKVCLWTTIVILFLAILCVIVVMAANHGKLYKLEDINLND
eukprot:gene8242-16949_t